MLITLRSTAILVVCFTVLSFCRTGISQTDAPRSIEARKTSQPPEIDGSLGDPCWQKAPKTTDFVDMLLDKIVLDQTVVYLLYDDANIYIAFHCYDSQPDKIVARETKRDGSYWNDDHFSFWIDPFHAHQSQYRSSFTVNAIGTQFSKIAGGRASKTEWKGNWEATARRTHDGWTGEMSIPFAILSHPANDEPVTIGINFSRRQPHTDIHSFWSNIGYEGHTEKDGHLTGISFPKKRSKRRLSTMIYALGGYESDEEATLRAGLDAKYSVTSGITTVASINPDFSNVAQVVESIDFSYRERYYPDRRPFFQEGASMIKSGSWGFYSRRIPQFDLGLKTYGKVGRITIGALNCTDFSNTFEIGRDPADRNDLLIATRIDLDKPINRNDMVIEARMDLGKSSVIPLQFVRKDDTESWNHALICKPGFRWKNLSIKGLCAGSQTKGGKDGGSYSASINWDTKYFYTSYFFSSLTGFYVTPGFEIADGLVPYTDAKGGDYSVGCRSEWRSGILKSVEGGMYAGMADRLDGTLYERNKGAYGRIHFRSDHSVNLGFDKGRYEEYRDQTLWLDLAGNLSNYDRLYGLSIMRGRQGGADYTLLSPYISFGFFEKLSLGLSSEFLWHAENTRQHILTFNYDITPEHSLGTRLVYQDHDFNAFITYRQVVRKGIDVFIIIGDPNAKEMQRRALAKIILPL